MERKESYGIIMKYYIVKLIFKSPLHIGSPYKGIGVENVQAFINSDTIFSAFCNTWIKYDIIPLSKIEILDKESSFLLSSAFPYVQKRRDTYFLPTPKLESPNLCNFRGSSDEKSKLKKLLKKSSFIPSIYFKDYLNPQRQLFNKSYDEIVEDITEQNKSLTEKTRVQHAQDRLTGASQIYHLGEIHFDPDEGGLFFIIKLNDEQWESYFNDGLKALSREGIGGEKSFGMGTFKCDDEFGTLIEIQDYDDLYFLTQPSLKFHYYCNLSLFYPHESDIIKLKSKNIYYDLIFKKGWTFSTSSLIQAKKKTIPFFTEGSLFDFEPIGKVVDVRPENEINFPHPVFKWGKPLTALI